MPSASNSPTQWPSGFCIWKMWCFEASTASSTWSRLASMRPNFGCIVGGCISCTEALTGFSSTDRFMPSLSELTGSDCRRAYRLHDLCRQAKPDVLRHHFHFIHCPKALTTQISTYFRDKNLGSRRPRGNRDGRDAFEP